MLCVSLSPAITQTGVCLLTAQHGHAACQENETLNPLHSWSCSLFNTCDHDESRWTPGLLLTESQPAALSLVLHRLFWDYKLFVCIRTQFLTHSYCGFYADSKAGLLALHSFSSVCQKPAILKYWGRNQYCTAQPYWPDIITLGSCIWHN